MKPPEDLSHPSQDVRMKRSASYPEMDNCLNCSPNPDISRPLYKWQDDDNDFKDNTWNKAAEFLSPREKDRWRRSLYSVFVGHLPKDITKKELCELFEKTGCVQDIHLADTSGKNFTYGFVRFGSYEEAKEAVQTFHNRTLAGRHITVEFASETQKLLDKEDVGYSDKEGGKLLKRYPSMQRYKPLSADEADEKMVQWKLRQCTEKLKSSHACYVRDYMETEKSAHSSAQTHSDATIDQEETLKKIQEILKKVAEIPGPEKAATAKADQGPEQTIVPWPKENDRVSKDTEFSQQVSISQAQQISERQVNVEPVSRNCAQNKSVEEAPAEKSESNCVTEPKNPPNDTKIYDNQSTTCCHVNPTQTFRSTSLLGNPIFTSNQFSPEAILAQQVATYGRNPFPTPNLPIQYPGCIGFPTEQNFPGFSPYLSRGLIPGFPSTPRVALQQGPAFGQFTPPQVPFHQAGNNTWPIQQRMGGLSRASSFHPQSFPQLPPTRRVVHKKVNPRQLAPVFSAIDQGKTTQTTFNGCNSNSESRDKEAIPVANVTTLSKSKSPNDTVSPGSSDTKSWEPEGTLHSRDDSFGTQQALPVENQTSKKTGPATKRSKKLADALRLVINSNNKDPGYSSTSSGSEDYLKGVTTQVNDVKSYSNVERRKKQRDSVDSGVASPGDELSRNEIELVELKMELERIDAENKKLQKSLSMTTSPRTPSCPYRNEASAALKQKIKELEVNLQREKEIISSRNNEQELLYEREKLEAAFDNQCLKQLEVELELNNITGRVYLARLQQDLLKLYHEQRIAVE